MNDNNGHNLSLKYLASLSMAEVFLNHFQERYIAMLDIFKDGTKRLRKGISDQIQKSDIRNDIGGYAENEFLILDEISNINSHVFKVYTIVTMYSETEILLKEWLTYLYKNESMRIGNFNDIKAKYKCKGIDLPKFNNYNDFNCLRKSNNSIKHNSKALENIYCPFLSKTFKAGDNIEFSEGEIVEFAQTISAFMLSVRHKVTQVLDE